MSSLEFDAPDEIPPPAYEFSQEEFDQKISHALDASQTATDEPDEWETWDEAAFAAAAAQLTLSDPTDRASSSRSPPAQTHFSSALASSSSATNYNNGSNAYSSGQGSSDAGLKTQPLRVVKKSRPSSAGREKERPSWYAEAQLDTVNTPPAPAPRPQRQPSPPRSSLSHSISVISRSGNGEREPTPPPMFEPIGPSLDGPPYEGFDGQNPATQGLVMTYVPGDSRPASPLHSPTSPSLAPAYPQAPPLVQPSAERRSLPRPLPHAAPSVSPPVSPPPRQPYQSASPPPRQTYQSVPQPRVPVPRVSPRPVTSYNARPKSYAPPRIAFDPRVAYGGADSKGSSYFANREELPPPTNIDPASFYT
ncbi:hypothetical protein BDW22DRAFT_369635 [Trametopsis cervina]|nr:hypothetical protein BDW22DRAFT_369635 [Trametopsis cervina]